MKRIIIGIAAAVVMARIAYIVHAHRYEFYQLVTEQVVRTAVRELAEDMKNGYTVWPTTRDAGVVARHAVYSKFFGQGWFRLLYASIAAAPEFSQDTTTSSGFWVKNGGNEAMYATYKKILATARERLKDPTGLTLGYFRFKDAASEEVVSQGIKKEILEGLDYAIPFFEENGIAPKSLEIYKMTLSLEIDKMTVEWVERRRAEGGDELVATWLLCLKDFRNTLSIQQAGM